MYKKAAEYGKPEAMIETAKIYEHRVRDYSLALQNAKDGKYLLLKENPLRKKLIDETSHRIDRLKKKVIRNER